MKEKMTKTRLQRANGIILILHIIFPIWLIALMYTYAISKYWFLIALIAALLLGVIYKIVIKLQKGKKLLYTARVITIIIVLSFYVPVILLINFSHTKALYEIKRFDYAYGVYGKNSEFYKRLLPDKLPAVCDDYSFRTQGSMIGQDYHASSYLMFHTDSDSIDSYSEYYKNLDREVRVRVNNDESDDVKDDIDWFCVQTRLRESFQDNLDNAEIYLFDDYYPKAVLLNRETGLVAILT
ncbi:MAG: hypothetical protein ACI4JW_03905 [Oscillospiraceae bacterium]